MAAKIIRSEVMKSINMTMTVVVINETRGRVMFADSFGAVRNKRDFLNIESMEKFVADQLALEWDWRVANPAA